GSQGGEGRGMRIVGVEEGPQSERRGLAQGGERCRDGPELLRPRQVDHRQSRPCRWAGEVEDELFGGGFRKSPKLGQRTHALFRIGAGQPSQQHPEIGQQSAGHGGWRRQHLHRSDLAAALRRRPNDLCDRLREALLLAVGLVVAVRHPLPEVAPKHDQLLERARKLLAKKDEIRKSAAAHRLVRAITVKDSDQPPAHLDRENEDRPWPPAELRKKSSRQRIGRHWPHVASSRGANGAEDRRRVDWKRERRRRWCIAPLSPHLPNGGGAANDCEQSGELERSASILEGDVDEL